MADISGSIISLETGRAKFFILNSTVLGTGKVMSGWTATSQSISNSGVSSYVRGINLGGMVCVNGCSSGLPLMYGVTQSMSEGSPSAPSIAFNYAGMWRFKWSVVAGTRTITIKCKQVSNQSPRPSMVITANPSIGVPLDIETFASSGIGWVDIGPVTITPTSTGMVFIQIKNNSNDIRVDTPAYFDHIVVT